MLKFYPPPYSPSKNVAIRGYVSITKQFATKISKDFSPIYFIGLFVTIVIGINAKTRINIGAAIALPKNWYLANMIYWPPTTSDANKNIQRLFSLTFLKRKNEGSGDRSPIRFCLKDINTPGRDRTHQASSRKTSLRLQE